MQYTNVFTSREFPLPRASEIRSLGPFRDSQRRLAGTRLSSRLALVNRTVSIRYSASFRQRLARDAGSVRRAARSAPGATVAPQDVPRTRVSRPSGWLQSPELKTRQLDGLFNLRSGKSVWGMLIGLDQTCRNPRRMLLRQFATRGVTGKCVQVRPCFRSEHIDEHIDAFRNA